MIPQGLFTQIGMVIISGAIIVTYVQPIFTEIGVKQKDIAVYQEKIKSVSAVNERLNSLSSRLNSVSMDDNRRLLTYMPDEIDSISIVRDLFLISNEAGVFYVDSQYEGEVESKRSSASSEDDQGPYKYSFTLSVEGTYNQLKELVNLLEQNNYPLEIHNLDIDQLEGGFLSANLSLVTYSYKSFIIGSDNKIEF